MQKKEVHATRLRAGLRAALYLSLLSTVALGWSAHTVYAEGERKVRALAERVVSELGPNIVGHPQLVEINGQRLILGSKQSTLPVREILDRFETTCDENEDLQSTFAEPSTAPASMDATPDPVRAFLQAGPRKFSTWRSDLDTEGQFSCFAVAPGARGLGGFVERASKFLETGDLSTLGQIRYLTARKLENGKTHVIAVWSQGSLALGAMFPESGDAPGSDMSDVPRPPNARRNLSATVAGHDYGLRIYASPAPAAEVARHYEQTLSQRGYEQLDLKLPNGALRDGVLLQAFTRSERTVLVAIDARARRRSAGTSVSLIDMGAVRHAQVVAQMGRRD